MCCAVGNHESGRGFLRESRGRPRFSITNRDSEDIMQVDEALGFNA
uniref:Uncharacterized protein n=1 Tax=Rubinisphaera brasiliensis (strain ATCC 49424 / DSM 5305 / JCM 21570 / IAM 15109 / NBRC 103401 / IFAM 1448) TaxID=756272 RepID=F0SRJ6_RUBBR|nr:hypothetical protein Plabr_1508 [Rubinisphaera brasiliensis DSM 5305]